MTKAELTRIVARALDDVDPQRRVEEALPEHPPRDLPVRIVAIGKAAPAMARGALSRWGRAVEACVVVAPDETEVRSLGRAVILRGSHPLPDARSVRAARACLDVVTTRDRRFVLVLVSGGASSLVCAPAPGVTLRDKRAVTRAMLRSGASIQQVNVVRKHLSSIKGGALARAAFPNAVSTLVVSDVIGGGPSDVGSGPSSPDSSSVGDARRLLRRFAPAHAELPLRRTLSRRDREARGLRSRVVACPEELGGATARRLRDLGFTVRVLRASQAPVTELAEEYSRLAGRLQPGHALVRVAEPAVAVPRRAGRGGRSTHLTALVARALARDPASLVMFGAVASDGVDGSSGTAGALVDGSLIARARARLGASAFDRALETFSTGALHLAMRSAIAERPSGHNLGDVHVLLRARERATTRARAPDG